MFKVTNARFEFHSKTIKEVFDTLSTWEWDGPVAIEEVVASAKPIKIDEWKNVTLHLPKRNKQVDVPTEAWQKRIERQIEDMKNYIRRVEKNLSSHLLHHKSPNTPNLSLIHI